MSILTMQRRLMEAGRIRIGQQVATSNGRTRPEKLTTFRLTSRDQRRIESATQLFGGKMVPWKAPDGQQWEVITDRDWLDVIVPPAEMCFSQHMEMWSAGGCTRRCDGAQESISDGPCLCDPDKPECAVHTRLSVMLSELPGLGVWRLDTSGWYAAQELGAAVQIVQAAAQQQMLPARLRLEQRTIKRPNEPPKRFAVPVLDIDITPAQLLGGHMPNLIARSAPAEVAALPSGVTALPSVVTPVPAAPDRTAEQVRAVDQPTTKPPRRNAQAPIPATGVRPRTAAQAAGKPESKPTDRKATVKQKQMLAILAQKQGWDDDERHRQAGVASFSDLSSREASALIDDWQARPEVSTVSTTTLESPSLAPQASPDATEGAPATSDGPADGGGDRTDGEGGDVATITDIRPDGWANDGAASSDVEGARAMLRTLIGNEMRPKVATIWLRTFLKGEPLITLDTDLDTIIDQLNVEQVERVAASVEARGA